MSTPQTTGPGGLGAVPVACSLGAGDLAAQAGRWLRLASQAMIERTETAAGLRITFRPGPEAEDELRALATVENECCSWATWTVLAGDGELALEVCSAGDGVATLHSLFSGS